MSWRYGMVLVARAGEPNPRGGGELDEDLCALVELYECPEEMDEYRAFCAASIESVKDLKTALWDIEGGGGVNTWFYENGTFVWDPESNDWDWIRASPK